jgi:hypothetical protein
MEENQVVINGKFNNKHPKYKSIKYTNVTLFVIFYFLEVIAAEVQGQATGILGLFITFWVARYFIREIFKKNPDFNYKILTTIGVYFGTFVLKTILAIILLLAVGGEF